MNNFRKLNVWKKGVSLATIIYEHTNTFPEHERYGLSSQMRRSVVSIGSNVAEGAGRESKNEFRHFLNYAMGSCYELETQLIIARNLNYVNGSDFKQILVRIIEIQKMLYTLIKSLQ